MDVHYVITHYILAWYHKHYRKQILLTNTFWLFAKQP